MTEERFVSQCSDCGGEIIFSAGQTTVRCAYCRAMNQRPKKREQNRNLKYANELRNHGEFAAAEQAYLSVLEESPDEVEARWGRLLSKYGVIYVEDKERQECHITCRRSVGPTFRNDHDYRALLKMAEPEIREKYEKDAEYIDLVQAGIQGLHKKEKPYDVFLCYKETDDHGGRTEDSVRMQEIYNELSKEGYRVFFARETLKKKTGADYEAAIFAAIERSRVMLVMGTRKEYFEATWVRSEWRRFLEKKKEENGENKVLLPLFRDEKDFPEEFSNWHIQGYKMEGPYLLDVKTRLLELLRKKDPRFNLAEMYLQIGQFDEADELLKEMQKEAPGNARIWLYRAMAAEKISKEADFAQLRHSLKKNSYFRAAMNLSNETEKEKLRGYLDASEKNAREAENQVRERAMPEREKVFAPSPRADKEWVRGIIALEDGEYDRAAQVFSQMVEDDPTDARAWLGKLMTEKRVCREEDLAQAAQPFAGNRNYERALRFGDEALRARLTGYENAVKQRLATAAQEETAKKARLEDALKKARALHAKKDYANALEQYRVAAQYGIADAQNMVGYYYEEGFGVEKNDAEAVQWFRKAAEQGLAAAQFNLGLKYYRGEGTEKSFDEAAKWFRKAAEQGYAYGQNWLGHCYEHGYGVGKDLSRAESLYEQAAKNGSKNAQENLEKLKKKSAEDQINEALKKAKELHQKKDYVHALEQYRIAGERDNAEAQNMVGRYYEEGWGIEKNDAEAVKWFRKAAEQGLAAAQFNLGRKYYRGAGTAQSYDEAVKWFLKAADQGDADGQNWLGYCYEYGYGVGKDLSRAESLYEQAAKGGNKNAQENLERLKNKKTTDQTDDPMKKAKAFDQKKDYVHALEQYRVAADLGSADAQNMVGRYYEEGLGVEKNDIEAVQWFRKAAEQGFAVAQTNLGVKYYRGRGVQANTAEAVKWFRKAAEQGHANGQNWLGHCYEYGCGVEKDLSQAETLYEQAAKGGNKNAQENLEKLKKKKEADQIDDPMKKAKAFDQNKDYVHALEQYRIAANLGSADAQNMVGRYYAEGFGVEKNDAEAVKWFRKAAEQGFAAAQFNLGLKYYRGEGTVKSYDEAVKWFRKAADQGYAYGQNWMGFCYEYGYGVEKDLAQAETFYEQAAKGGNKNAQENLEKLKKKKMTDQTDDPMKKAKELDQKKDYVHALEQYRIAADRGSADAQNMVGRYYEEGLGVEKNDIEAVQWFRKAADQGFAVAQTNLGVKYYRGRGVEASFTEAAKWFRKAAEQGHASGQNWLGFCYEHGHGVGRDLLRAESLYEQAAKGGNKNAQEHLEKLKNKKAGDQINEALKKAKELDQKKDYVHALEQYRIAANLGGAEAQNMMGRYYEDGLGVEKNDVEAVKWFRKGADQGLAVAQTNLGVKYYRGQGVQGNIAEAVKWFRKATEQGNASGQTWLGYCCQEGYGVEKNAAEAVGWYRKAAAQGYSDGQYRLGYCYQYGVGVEKSEREALEWYQKASAGGSANAKKKIEEIEKQRAAAETKAKAEAEELARAQKQGYENYVREGIALYDQKEYAGAVKLFQKASMLGNANGQYWLGKCYAKGEGVVKNEKSAVQYYRWAADKGNADAMCALGSCYERGSGVEADGIEAIRWYQKAADLGDKWAEYSLARCYSEGKIVQQDLNKAERLCRKIIKNTNRMDVVSFHVDLLLEEIEEKKKGKKKGWLW